MAFEINNIKFYNNLIFGAINKELNLKKQKKLLSQPGDTYIPGGYVQSFASKKERKKRIPHKLEISPLQWESLKQIVGELTSRNIKYVIVQAPCPRTNYDSYTNNDEIDRRMSALGAYYNFNKVMILPDKMYLDESHLNQSGVDVFNARLIDTLKKSDHLLFKNPIRKNKI